MERLPVLVFLLYPSKVLVDAKDDSGKQYTEIQLSNNTEQTEKAGLTEEQETPGVEWNVEETELSLQYNDRFSLRN